VIEPRVGLSFARNRALEVLDADYVAFLDDDVVVNQGWAESALACLEQSPAPAGMAGRIDLEWEVKRPRWSTAVTLVDAQLAALDLGPEARRLEAGEVPYGANMILDRRLAQAVGGFDIELGRKGRSLRGMEDVDIAIRMAAATERPFLWCPGAAVRHAVPKDRTRFVYHLKRAYAQGVGESYLMGAHSAYMAGVDAPWKLVREARQWFRMDPSLPAAAQVALLGAYAAGRQAARSGRS
jgi:GT2 family glycosyltransferase